MPNSHRAYVALDGQQVGGYTVHVSNADADGVVGELLRESRTPLGFTIEADEHQFEVSVTIADILREFAEYIQQNALSPRTSHLRVRYP